MFKSDEERVFWTWLFEAEQAGVIEGFKYEPRTHTIYDKTTYTKIVQLKTKTKQVERHLLNGLKYTPDFEIYVSEAQIPELELFGLKMPSYSIEDGCYMYVVDTKGGYSKVNDADKFSVLQKTFYHECGLYANKVIPHKFFLKAWLPMPMLQKKDIIWTDKKVLKSGVVREQKKRSKFKKAKTFEEKYK